MPRRGSRTARVAPRSPPRTASGSHAASDWATGTVPEPPPAWWADAPAASGWRLPRLRASARARRARALLDEDDATALLSARGPEIELLAAAADRRRLERAGDVVTYVVCRNINYTNVCYFRCGFCAFSKGKLAENLRGPAYLLSVDEVARRCGRGVVTRRHRGLPAGRHPPGLQRPLVPRAAACGEGAVPAIHVHAFSPLEVWQGAATEEWALADYLTRLGRRASARCPAPPRRSWTTTCGGSSARTRSRPRSGCRSCARRTASACARRRRSCSGTSRTRATRPGTS